MLPADGSWGIAERLVIKENNSALAHMQKDFPTHSEVNGKLIIEHRRPDCNFQAALAFALLGKNSGSTEAMTTADNLLNYLYNRSASRNTHVPSYPQGTWRWSDDRWIVPVWYDDNSWCAFIPLLLSKLVPEFEAKYQLVDGALETTHELYHALNLAQDRFGNFKRPEFLPLWNGWPNMPHFGSLVCMALGAALHYGKRPDYELLIKDYYQFIVRNIDQQDISECTYILMGASVCASAGCDTLDLAVNVAEHLLRKLDNPYHNLPSEHGTEAPVGEHLMDLIYTTNWACLGFQMLNSVKPDKRYSDFLQQTAQKLVEIQDESGCWHGMFDLKANCYGGGDCYEGGANSIYTGWTNAPICCFLSLLNMNKSFIDLLPR